MAILIASSHFHMQKKELYELSSFHFKKSFFLKSINPHMHVGADCKH